MIVTIIITLVVISLVSSVKFGFVLKDDEDIFAEKFVAFGVLPTDITQDEMVQISDGLNRFYQADRKSRQKKQYSVTLFEQLRLPNGNYQVALRGELSSFLASLRMTIINVVEPLEIWTRVKFYSDPIASVDERPMVSRACKVFLLKAAFDKFEIQPHQDLKELYHPQTTAEPLAINLEEYDIDYDDGRYTIIEFQSSTGSLRNPLVDTPSKSSLRSKLINNGKSARSCCNSCVVS